MKPYRSVKLRTAARDRSCVLCQAKDGTIVPAHLPGAFYGMPGGSIKVHDWLMAHLCFECHENMDTIWRKDAQVRLRALCLTLERLFNEGIVSTVER